MILSYLESMVQVVLAMAFGYTFGLSDLLSTKGYRWFPSADVFVGAAAGLIGVSMLWLSLGGVHAFWLATLLTWTLFGRMFAPGKLLMVATLGGYLAWWGVSTDNLDAPALAYFFVAMPALTAAFAFAARSKKPTRWVSLVGARQSWPAYLVVLGYIALFELDFSLIGVVWAFFSGVATIDGEDHRAKLRTWGVRRA